MLRIFEFVPGLIYVAIIYGITTLAMGGSATEQMAHVLISITLPSGADWQLTTGHIFILLAALGLFFELLKSTNPTDTAIAENGISAVSLLFFLLLFVLVRAFGTTEFFFIVFMQVLDTIVGLVVLVSTARRTIDHER
jgi:hypothetical protein